MSQNDRGTALYRLYRSQKFKDVVGQPHIVKTLQGAIKHNRLSHAYLFVGPRGVGKTSVARILAHEVNGLAYTGQSNHLDIVEIDAASNRGIDEIRDLRDKAFLAPSSARYKVYIIDEVHMLTAPAFSALLKTLEEPPAHVMFIMATTEGHKIPATILSRAQRFTFLPINRTEAEQHLAAVAKQEGLKVEAKALSLMAEYGFGSLRDSLGLLDQLSHLKQVTSQDVIQLIGLAPETIVVSLMEALSTGGQSNGLIKALDEARAQGVSPALLARQLIERIRQGSNPQPAQIDLYQRLLEVATAHDPELKLEVTLLAHSLDQTADNSMPTGDIKTPSEGPTKTETRSATSSTQSLTPTSDAKPVKLPAEDWQAILEQVKSGRSSLYAVLRQASPARLGDELWLEFKFSFHRNRAEEANNKQMIQSTASSVLGPGITVKTAVNDQLAEVPASSPSEDNVGNVIELMGGGDIMEYEDG